MACKIFRHRDGRAGHALAQVGGPIFFRGARWGCPWGLVGDGLHLAVDLLVGRRACRLGRGRIRTGQVMSGLLAEHDAPAGGEKAHDQADFFARPTGLVPGEPHAVAVAQFGFGVVPSKLLRSEHVLAVGLDVVRVPAVLLKGVHHTRSLHTHRLSAGGGIEQQAASKSPRGCAPRWLHDAVGPDGYDPAGELRLFPPEQARGRGEAQ